jgi:hypothetical protein
MAHGEWFSLWELGTPEEVAQILTRLFGTDAELMASECASAAMNGGRDEDYRFWIAVLARLIAKPPAESDGSSQ